MRKTLAYIVTSVFVITVLAAVYLFITRGYSKEKTMSQDTLVANQLADSEATESGSMGIKLFLIVTKPTSGGTLTSTKTVVKGKTIPGAEVFVNDIDTIADMYGNFSVNVDLEEGNNQIMVYANDSNGNVVEQNVIVDVKSF